MWREKDRTNEFREHCLFIADIYLSLVDLVNNTEANLNFYTRTDLYYQNYLINPHPDAYFVIESESKDKTRYFLDVLEDIPAGFLRRRVKDYADTGVYRGWHKVYPNRLFPYVILVCRNKRMKGHLYHFIHDNISSRIDFNFYLTTKDTIRDIGMCREALEKVDMDD